jgi:phage shock protein A
VSVTGPTRESACLALGHDDTGEVRCPATDERLIRELVAEVQRLRVVAGVVEETAADRDEQRDALDDALDAAGDEWETGLQLAQTILDYLAENGWRLVPAPRP